MPKNAVYLDFETELWILKWLTNSITFGKICNAKNISQSLYVLAETSLLKVDAQLVTAILSSNS